METIFDKIINGEIPADKVYETDYVLAFLDIAPTTKGHTLVIPKKPIKDIFELDDETASHTMQGIVCVANAVKKATGAAGVNIISNNGHEAGQEVFHLHFHIIPRNSRSEFPNLPHTKYEDNSERETFAQKIRDSI